MIWYDTIQYNTIEQTNEWDQEKKKTKPRWAIMFIYSKPKYIYTCEYSLGSPSHISTPHCLINTKCKVQRPYSIWNMWNVFDVPMKTQKNKCYIWWHCDGFISLCLCLSLYRSFYRSFFCYFVFTIIFVLIMLKPV